MSLVAPLRPNTFYHIYLSASNSTTLFATDADFLQFLALYGDYIEPIAETFAYCLLTNHFHFFVRTKQLQEQITDWYAEVDGGDSVHPELAEVAEFVPLNPDRQFAKLLAAYSSTTQRPTALINLPIQRIALSDDALYPQLVRYIHQNPAQHQQTDNFRTYRWSSYRALLSRQPTRLAVKTVIDWFHGEEWFDEMHWIPVDEPKIGYLILED